jgi:hypothetical protein
MLKNTLKTTMNLFLSQGKNLSHNPKSDEANIGNEAFLFHATHKELSIIAKKLPNNKSLNESDIELI